MNLLCQVFINPGDVILVESPTFVHCVEIFEMFQAKCVPVDMDENGMDIEDCEKKIKKFKPKMVYVIPTFQNPTGITLSQERRERLAALGDKYDVIILEDDPYRDIRFNGKDLTPIKAFDQTGHTVLANSFSKIFSPGSRLGYCVAEKEIINHLCDIKTATNSHTGMISEVLCAEFFKRGYYPEHHRKITSIYRERCGVMIKSDRPAERNRRNIPDDTAVLYDCRCGEIDASECIETFGAFFLGPCPDNYLAAEYYRYILRLIVGRIDQTLKKICLCIRNVIADRSLRSGNNNRLS